MKPQPPIEAKERFVEEMERQILQIGRTIRFPEDEAGAKRLERAKQDIWIRREAIAWARLEKPVSPPS